MSASVIVIGGGPTGLSATYHLGQDAILLEQNDTIGGWYRSIEDGGFTFDYAGHIMFSKDEYVHAMYRTLLGDNVHWQDREAWVYSKNVYTRYPFQGALYGLPADVIKECIVGAVEARYGKTEERSGAMIAPAKPASASGKIAANGNGNGNGHAVSANGNGKANGMYSAAAVIGKSNGNGHAASANGNGNGAASSGIHGADDKEVVDCCTDGTTEIASGATVTASEMPDIKAGEPRNFEEFIYKVWGAGIAKHFAIPYNRKLWAVPLAEMETSWLGGRVPLPNLEEMIEGALSPVAKPMGPNARFGYPLRDGLRWHLIEQKPGRYDWSSCLPQLRAAQATGTQVIWDLCHYGWPDDLDLWSPAFVERFARFARAAAQIVRDETDSVPLYVPIKEMSFWSWGGGEVAYLNPFERGRGFELKVQLARASIAAIEEIWQVDARARIIHADPLISIASDPTRPDTARSAEGNHQAQYQGWDLLSGRL